MAKAKRKGAKRRTSRRRRMSGASGETIKMFGGIMIGVIGGSMLAQKVAPTMDQKIKGAVLLAGGLFASTKVSGALMEGIALGAGVAGGTSLLKGFGVISGASANRMVAGNLANRQVNGNLAMRQVNGGMVNGRTNGMMVNGVSDAESMAYALASSM